MRPTLIKLVLTARYLFIFMLLSLVTEYQEIRDRTSVRAYHTDDLSPW